MLAPTTDALQVDVYQADADGGHLRRLTQDKASKEDLAWIQTRAGWQVAYTTRLPDQPQTALLNSIDPQTGVVHRVYPPLALTGLECPTHFAQGYFTHPSSSVQISMSNNSQQPGDIPIILRAASHPLNPLTDPKMDAVHVETITLMPGEERTLKWFIAKESSLKTYFMAVIQQDAPNPFYFASCDTTNTFFGLPNLGFLVPSFLLTLFGMAFCMPWLRQQKRGWLWALWVATPFLILTLVGLEINIAGAVI